MVQKRLNQSIAEIIAELKKQKNPKNIAGMVRFGISQKGTLGIPTPVLRKMAKEIGKNHQFALELWKSGIHEARILAGFIDDPKLITEQQMEDWVKDFDSWDVCDQVCGSSFEKTGELAWKKIDDWSSREEEFVKRTSFALIACLAWHDKKATDNQFEEIMPLIIREATDERNFVRKAVNWALRNIGKRNKTLNKIAIETAKKIQKTHSNSKSARWIAADAIRELESKAVQKRLVDKEDK
jgi:3-methyladenine DNA glycosylase AlkD